MSSCLLLLFYKILFLALHNPPNILGILLLSLWGYTYQKSPLVSLPDYESKEFYTSGGFQDFTDYAKYHYAEVDMTENAYFTKIQESDISKIHTHLDDFENWVEIHRKSDSSNELVIHYDFDRSIIDEGDYIYIESEGHTWSDGHTSFTKYNVYFLANILKAEQSPPKNPFANAPSAMSEPLDSMSDIILKEIP